VILRLDLPQLPLVPVRLRLERWQVDVAGEVRFGDVIGEVVIEARDALKRTRMATVVVSFEAGADRSGPNRMIEHADSRRAEIVASEAGYLRRVLIDTGDHFGPAQALALLTTTADEPIEGDGRDALPFRAIGRLLDDDLMEVD
jgi:hypothetical protein